MDLVASTIMNLILSADTVAMCEGERVLGMAPAVFGSVETDLVTIKPCAGAVRESGTADKIALMTKGMVVQCAPLPKPVALMSGQEFALSSFRVQLCDPHQTHRD